MTTSEGRGIVLMDVDGVISNGLPARIAAPRPGIQFTIDLLTCLGFEVHLWSAGGAEHARSTAEKFVLHGAVRGYHDKPEHPMTTSDVQALLGGRSPVMQVDDDGSERVPGWAFMEIETFYVGKSPQ